MVIINSDLINIEASMDNEALLLEEFCQQQQLPPSYADLAAKWFLPLAEDLSIRQAAAGQCLLVGINGSQGSGKSTLCGLLETILTAKYSCRVVTLSIDDFYLTAKERAALAVAIHPLLNTRGVPGTHDIALLTHTIDTLLCANKPSIIPRFDKARDDRKPKYQWDVVEHPVDIILLEGWCVGSSALDDITLATPINALEQQEDASGIWRKYISDTLVQQYVPFFSRLDYLLFLQIPDFNCVYQWRKKQEDKLRVHYSSVDNATGNVEPSGLMNDTELMRFIHHFQRLTEHNLSDLPSRADTVFMLDQQHNIIQRYNNE